MNKNTLIILAIAVVAVVGGYLLLRGSGGNYGSNTAPVNSVPVQSNTESIQQNQNDNKMSVEETLSDSNQQNSLIVTYTDSGFSPNNLIIKNGQTVTFKNESSGEMWVASAPHPTHTDYPEFDAKKSYASGQSYTFNFTKAGTWKYHNHKNPSNFGSVTVE